MCDACGYLENLFLPSDSQQKQLGNKAKLIVESLWLCSKRQYSIEMAVAKLYEALDTYDKYRHQGIAITNETVYS